LINFINNLINQKETNFFSLVKLLEAFSFKRTLDKGFALVIDSFDNPIKLSSQASKGSFVKIQFSDNIRTAKLDK
jgi:exonuclease VII large subunit